MAEYLMRHALAAESHPLNQLKVASAGIAAWEGAPASQNTITALKKVNIAVNHHSRNVSQALLDQCIAVFCMTRSHHVSIVNHFHHLPSYIFCMRALIPNIHDKNIEIADPYGQNLEAYENCRDEMIEAIPFLISFLRSKIHFKTSSY